MTIPASFGFSVYFLIPLSFEKYACEEILAVQRLD